MNPKPALAISCLLAGLLVLSATQVSASEGDRNRNVTVRAKIGLEYNDNVFEETDDRTGGLTVRSYLDLSSTPFRSRRVLTSLQYQGALKRYLSSPTQDSLSAAEPIINSLNLSLQHELTKGIVTAIEGEIKNRTLTDRGKRHLPSQVGYLQGAAGLSLKVRLAGNLSGTFSYLRSFANFRELQELNFWAQEAGFYLDRRFSRGPRCRLGASWKRFKFNRGSLNGRLEQGGKLQRDTLRRVEVDFKFYKVLLISGGYAFLKNRSNSYGYSFNAHRLTVALGKTFPKEISLQLYGILQLKRYTEHIQGFPLVPIPRETEGNLFVVKLSKDITDRCGIDAQYGLYRDESVRGDGFHTKSLYSCSLSLSF